MPPASDRRSPVALIVLASLAERPAHVYGLFQQMQQRGKTDLAPIPSRATLYPVLDRLQRSGFVEVATTERDANRPERTVYRVTDAGLAAAHDWLLAYLAGSDRVGFAVALSFAMMCAPTEVLTALRARSDLLAHERSALLDGLAAGDAMGLPALFQLDERYRIAVLDADASWLDGTIAGLDVGELTWSREWIERVAAQLEG